MINGRERWHSRGAFIMAAVGSAVGLGNVWRFPFVAYKSGGGAFFVPYLIALLTAGIPVMMLEYALGTRFQAGAPRALGQIHKGFKWVGWLAVLVALSITFYYVAIMAYSWEYMFASVDRAWEQPTSNQTVARVTTGPFGIFGDVLNCLDQQSFVSQPCLLTKVLVGPGEDRHNILLGSRGEYETCHGD